jgi:heat-inducible transcriptional repressor
VLTRRDKILKLIVEYFIKNAQPIGSQTLIDEYHLDYSSATIRSEMNALESDGLLEKTHTSSGRVPSSKGYKYYVSNLRDNSLNGEIRNQLQSVFSEKVKSVEEIIKESCEILSHMTNLASIVLGPNAMEETLASVQIIPLNEKSASAVFVTSQGYVESKTFILNERVNMTDVEKCVKIMNERLVGTSISELVPKMEAIKPLISDYVIDHDMLYRAVMEAFVKFAADRLSLYGRDELLEQPEFANDTARLKKVLEFLDNPEKFRQVLSKEKNHDGVKVHIGDANGDNISVVSAEFNVPGNKESSIALVGPTRMDYDKVVAALEYVAQELENYFNQKQEDTKCQKKKKK